jgi:hypothetical protein
MRRPSLQLTNHSDVHITQATSGVTNTCANSLVIGSGVDAMIVFASLACTAVRRDLVICLKPFFLDVGRLRRHRAAFLNGSHHFV